jgi:hypothetical protein
MKRSLKMGRVKSMCMDMEDKWHGIAIDIIKDCEHIEEYLKRMNGHSELIDWKDDWQEDSHQILTDYWNEYWSKYNL